MASFLYNTSIVGLLPTRKFHSPRPRSDSEPLPNPSPTDQPVQKSLSIAHLVSWSNRANHESEVCGYG
ncbi:hypothetical protein M747DRAFT_293600 [Aspergillus niger ATCC 13496]|uniref:Uncharacterized protein n=1 Tax=Aspergillus niger ATCC 13496 TaxID=1353008 RepID=A0A370C5N6_ASPNG|nr:hypothetical protein M747DRAFT_293600 [Aspergillus niger ATCC 13496]